MLPTFSDFFISFYYSNTYVPAVDLSDQALSKDLLTENLETAQNLISHSAIRKILSAPLNYHSKEIKKNNQTLARHKFTILGSKTAEDPTNPGSCIKIPFYSVIEHKDLNGWIIKAGGARVSKDQTGEGPGNNKNEMAFFTKEDSILRIEMAKRIVEVACKANIKVIVPEKKLVAYRDLRDATEVTEKYCVVCKKIDILSFEETVEAIKNMDKEKQKDVAQKISTIVQKAGLVDASFNNIRLTHEGELAFIDTEPAGLMVAKKTGMWNQLFGSKGASVEKCARIGLYILMEETSKVRFNPGESDEMTAETGLEAFHEQVKNDYEKVSSPKLSKWKITLSVCSLGVIPLINAFFAFCKVAYIEATANELVKIAMEMEESQNLLDRLRQSPDSTNQFKKMQIIVQEENMRKFESTKTSIEKQFYATIENVPFTRVMVN